jgi:hypothetical protein
VDAASAESCNLSGGIKPGHRLAPGVKHAAVKIRLQSAQRHGRQRCRPAYRRAPLHLRVFDFSSLSDPAQIRFDVTDHVEESRSDVAFEPFTGELESRRPAIEREAARSVSCLQGNADRIDVVLPFSD